MPAPHVPWRAWVSCPMPGAPTIAVTARRNRATRGSASCCPCLISCYQRQREDSKEKEAGMATTDRLIYTAEDAAHDDSAVVAMVVRLEVEMRGLRARLREVEAAVGQPVRPGQAVATTLPELLTRVRTLERRAGLVPGFAPLLECIPALPSEEPAPTRG